MEALDVGVCLGRSDPGFKTVFALLQGALSQGPGSEIGWEAGGLRDWNEDSVQFCKQPEARPALSDTLPEQKN